MLKAIVLCSALVSTTVSIYSQQTQAGDFLNLAKIERLRTIHGGKYAELMENIEALSRTLDMLGVKGQPGTYDPSGINRAVGLIEAFDDKHSYGSIKFKQIPFILQDLRAISSGLSNSTVIYNCRKNSACASPEVRAQLTREERAAQGAWQEYREQVREYNKSHPDNNLDD